MIGPTVTHRSTSPDNLTNRPVDDLWLRNRKLGAGDKHCPSGFILQCSAKISRFMRRSDSLGSHFFGF